MTAFTVPVAQTVASHQHSNRTASIPTQLGPANCSQLVARHPARSHAHKRHRGMTVTSAVAATERPTGMQRPDASGRFGKYGGKYVPETLITALAELEAAYAETKNDLAFKVYLHVDVCDCWFSQSPHSRSCTDLQSEFAAILKDYVGRESPLYHADRLSEHYRK